MGYTSWLGLSWRATVATTREETTFPSPLQSIVASHPIRQTEAASDLLDQFEQVLAILDPLDITQIWNAAEFQERRTLVEELIEYVSIFPHHLAVKIAGVPKLNVTLSEVGLKESANNGVGGGT